MIKVTLEQKYNHCVALNIELEEIIEMQSFKMMKQDKQIQELKRKIEFLQRPILKKAQG